jgi:hypothetical protein
MALRAWDSQRKYEEGFLKEYMYPVRIVSKIKKEILKQLII